ncbi:MAG: polysaccharide deacetylase family protein [Caulobacter sp.]|nr:polysaccharide deacetylase family protein [Caulobacter sp.]
MNIRTGIATVATVLLLAGQAAAQPRTVAVTFDDLPYQASAAELCDADTLAALTDGFIAMLKPLDARATLFINRGKVCAAQADRMRGLLTGWLAGGFVLGNHTANHPNIHRMTVEAWLADVEAGDIGGPASAPKYFRHPYLFTGETPEKKAAMAAGLAERGYTVAPVTIDNNDWMFAAVYRKADLAGDGALKRRIGEAYVKHMADVLDHYEPYSAELTGGREPAQVLLLHANHLNRDWYPQIHALYLKRGYRFVSLEEALRDPVYALPETYVKANGVSWLHRWTVSAGRPIRWEPDPPDWIVKAYEAK